MYAQREVVFLPFFFLLLFLTEETNFTSSFMLSCTLSQFQENFTLKSSNLLELFTLCQGSNKHFDRVYMYILLSCYDRIPINTVPYLQNGVCKVFLIGFTSLDI